MSEDFLAVKESLDIIDVAQHYGVHIVKGNKAHCPFHNDRTPSLSFYEGNRKYHCFSCGAHGDVIDLVQRLLNISSKDALQELNNTYRLGLSLDTPFSSEKVRKAILRRERLQREKMLFQQWETSSYRILSAYFRTLQEWGEKYAPSHPGDPLHPRFIEALHRIDYIEYLLDTVYINGTKEEKDDFFRSHERLIRAIEQRLIREGVFYAGGNGAGFNTITTIQPIVQSDIRFKAAA